MLACLASQIFMAIWVPGGESMPAEAPCQVAVFTQYIGSLLHLIQLWRYRYDES
jgi:hypothetical protein